MRIAIYTLTRDRLEYTQRSFALLHEYAGYPFDHYVWDNGSKDGTVNWLSEWMYGYTQERKRFFLCSDENVGISRGSNNCISEIAYAGYDIVIKMDNDCEVVTPNILKSIVEIWPYTLARYVLSPRVEGINKQPTRVLTLDIGRHPIGRTCIVGGLFHIVSASTYREYRYPENLPLAKGQDDHLCDWWTRKKGGLCGYIEDLVVKHMDTTDGQAQKYPEYFERKWREEKEVPCKSE